MRKNGFTIVETSLVLAIGGLIIVLAFVVLPGLWRSQRDSQRKDDLMVFADAVKKWQSNANRGALPEKKAELDEVKDKYIKGTFEDPSLGTAYTLLYYSCDNESGSTSIASTECPAMKGIREAEISNNVTGIIHFVAGAYCDGNKAVKSPNSRKAALLYKLEVNELYCYDL